jgi:hypothetical protein
LLPTGLGRYSAPIAINLIFLLPSETDLRKQGRGEVGGGGWEVKRLTYPNFWLYYSYYT